MSSRSNGRSGSSTRSLSRRSSRAQPAQPVRVGGHLVARERDEQDRHVAQPAGELGDERERRLVRPVEVVEHDGDRPARAGLGERAAQRLDERRLARVLAPRIPSSGSSGAR